MGLFTHHRPHRQDTVRAAYVHHVCLNYRPAVTDLLLSTTDESERHNTHEILDAHIQLDCRELLSLHPRRHKLESLSCRRLQPGRRGQNKRHVAKFASLHVTAYLSHCSILLSLHWGIAAKTKNKTKKKNNPSCLRHTCLFLGLFYCSLTPS